MPTRTAYLTSLARDHQTLLATFRAFIDELKAKSIPSLMFEPDGGWDKSRVRIPFLGIHFILRAGIGLDGSFAVPFIECL